MSLRHRTAARTAPVSLTVLSMASVQLSDALSVPLIGSLGAPGTAWLRASLGALLVLVVVRPDVRSVTAHQWRAVVPLGLASALLSLTFLASLQWLPLGTAVAVEFLGPLAVAVTRAGPRAARWPVVALVGVVALTQPWQGDAPLVGVALAATSAAGWAACIVLTARVGARVPGLDGVALALPVAAVALAPWGCLTALHHLGPGTAAHGVGLAVLMPVLPFVLELGALRRLPQAAFATLMALEPALAAVVGGVVLHQRPGLLPVLGIGLVVLAGIATARAVGDGGTDGATRSGLDRAAGSVPDGLVAA